MTWRPAFVRAQAMLTVPVLCSGAWAADAGLRPFVQDSIDEIEDSHAGGPFILKLWSLDCGPCRAELPHWSDLARRFPDLALVLVSVDPYEDRHQVETFLTDHGLDGQERWIFADPFVQRLRVAIDPGWYGELPRTYFYPQGHERQAVSGRLSLDRVERWICLNVATHSGASSPSWNGGPC
ncbi:TlpA family protein disulfide reductase [Thioalkalivibrio nitratireducens]|uniref:TlpA family protein disulfide reductase n=1 Tax=Thioalkalivibrio nitratireducens TaxID=186931 RepID=UPI0005C18085|nr:TlpA disulfide reductase family protein [Thioalkalivibrio nitratireducens]